MATFPDVTVNAADQGCHNIVLNFRHLPLKYLEMEAKQAKALEGRARDIVSK